MFPDPPADVLTVWPDRSKAASPRAALPALHGPARRGADARIARAAALPHDRRTKPIGRGAMLKEFREFAMRGNVVDLAVGVVIGAAFGKIVTSLVSDIVMPPLGLILAQVDFNDLFINLSG